MIGVKGIIIGVKSIIIGVKVIIIGVKSIICGICIDPSQWEWGRGDYFLVPIGPRTIMTVVMKYIKNLKFFMNMKDN